MRPERLDGPPPRSSIQPLVPGAAPLRPEGLAVARPVLVLRVLAEGRAVDVAGGVGAEVALPGHHEVVRPVPAPRPPVRPPPQGPVDEGGKFGENGQNPPETPAVVTVAGRRLS